MTPRKRHLTRVVATGVPLISLLVSLSLSLLVSWPWPIRWAVVVVPGVALLWWAREPRTRDGDTRSAR